MRQKMEEKKMVEEYKQFEEQVRFVKQNRVIIESDVSSSEIEFTAHLPLFQTQTNLTSADLSLKRMQEIK